MQQTFLSILILMITFFGNAQDIRPERPIPITLNTKQVIIVDSIIDLSSPYSTKGEIDTISLMYLSPQGDVLVKYSYKNNKQIEQILYEYDSKHNIKHVMHRQTNCVNPFKVLIDDSLKTCFELKFEYTNRSKVSKAQWIVDDSIIEETTYLYDKSNRMIQSNNNHVKTNTSMKFVTSLDSTTYKYSNDTTFITVNYTDEKISYNMVEHKVNGRPILSYEIRERNKKDFEVESKYNSNGLLIEEKFNNSLPLYSGKILLRTNRVKYEYDSQKRISRKLFLANDSPVHVERYIYN